MDSAYYRDNEHLGHKARRPTDCDACEEAFTEIVQQEAGHILRTQGESAARAFVDEKLQSYHEEHE
jgi:Ribonuclease G/E